MVQFTVVEQFKARYQQLNAAQKEAVDTIDGPLMVVAGPGTGKTELLSVRVANILQKTDALPENILCLTFTESGAVAMRERLAGIIGQGAFKVAIHTFHSFGSDIINAHGEYFYHGAHFRPADELSSYEVLREIFDRLPHDNPLSSKMNDTYTYLGDAQRGISELKRSGLIPEELLKVLDHNDAFTSWAQPFINEVMSKRVSKKSLDDIRNLIHDLSKYQEEVLSLIGYQPLSSLVQASLQTAVDEAEEQESTKPLSAWKRDWCEKRADSELTLRDVKRSEKLRALAQIYYDYLVAMQKRELFDFDDMILRVVHGLELFDELRFDLQERYQYILVDEFQDTNDAQMRLIWNLTNNPSQNGRPNLMVVGDDDQAIYRFQGANVSNIIDFRKLYDEIKIVTLKDNYRSASAILDLARQVIVQGEERLENTLSIDKTLTPHQEGKGLVTFDEYADHQAECNALAEQIAKSLRRDSDKTIAIISRHHHQLRTLLPYLEAKGIPVTYERQDDVLSSEPIVQLELLARIVVALGKQQFDSANSMMPQLLAHPAWGLDTMTLWNLSINASKQRVSWFEMMLSEDSRLKDIAEWLIVSSHLAQHESLEYMLDHLFGAVEPQLGETTEEEGEPISIEEEDFVSPYRAFFFPHTGLELQPQKYLNFLRALQTLRSGLREYTPDAALNLQDFVRYIDLHRELGLSLQMHHTVASDLQMVTLLTAHKSKGLEFDEVYVIGVTDNVWGTTARSKGRLISFPHNLPLSPAGDSDDERLRLLYVALTRARHLLSLSTAQINGAGKPTLPVGYLTLPDFEPKSHKAESIAETIKEIRTDWQHQYLNTELTSVESLLRPQLENYKLSATHLANYLDVTKGGPELFLLQNLLRFPQAMSPASAYGSAIHGSLQRAHAHLRATGKRRPVEDVLNDFEELLTQYQLVDGEYEKFSSRGSKALTAFLEDSYDDFKPDQIAERDFTAESIVIDDARLTGKIDLMDIDEENKTISVTDYKTGQPSSTWRGRTDYEKVKLHHYEQQLMLYKLLVENSRSYRGYTVTSGYIAYVEPDANGKIIRLEYKYDDETLARFRTLINGVWNRIMELNFDSADEYDTKLSGILDFENDIIDSQPNK
jgi:DNA helicase-2/ATP-dependent DNA helicase PcrA